MNIAFFSVHWNAVSERWIQRMVGCLQDNIKFFVANDARKKWNDDIEGFSLIPPYHSEKLLNRLFLHILPRKYGRQVRDYQLRKLLHRKQIDIVLINYVTLAVNTQRIWMNYPARVFVHCHGFDVHFDSYWESPPFIRQHSLQYQNQVRSLPDNVTFIANSNHTKEKLREIGIASKRIQVKYFGVEIQPKIIRNCTDVVTILYLGRLVDFKGPDLLIKAFDIACQNGLKGRLLIAGDGPMLATCELLKRRSDFADRITMLGGVDAEKADVLYQKADIFSCHHSIGPISNREEAFGVTILEAMSFGLPVVTGASGGVCESVVDGRTGFLFKPGDVHRHADIILQLSKNKQLRESLGRNGRQRVQDHFSLELEKMKLYEIFTG